MIFLKSTLMIVVNHMSLSWKIIPSRWRSSLQLKITFKSLSLCLISQPFPLFSNVLISPSILMLSMEVTFFFSFSSIVSGAYAKPIFHDLLGAPLSSLHNCTPKPVFSPFFSYYRTLEVVILIQTSHTLKNWFMLWVWIVLVNL